MREVPESSVPASTGSKTITAETRTFEADRVEAANIDEWIGTVGRQWGENERAIFAARLCVAELFANVIEHGEAQAGRDHITVTLTRCTDGIGVEFLDTCARFDPTARVIAEQPDPRGSAAISGRGLMLIRAYTKELAYHNDGKYNHITLKIAR